MDIFELLIVEGVRILFSILPNLTRQLIFYDVISIIKDEMGVLQISQLTKYTINFLLILFIKKQYFFVLSFVV